MAIGRRKASPLSHAEQQGGQWNHVERQTAQGQARKEPGLTAPRASLVERTALVANIKALANLVARIELTQADGHLFAHVPDAAA